MINKLKVGRSRNLLLHIFNDIQFRINYLPALYADDMWMGVGVISIGSIAPIRESTLENLTQ